MFFGARIGRRRREHYHNTSAHYERRYRDLLFHTRNRSQSADLVEKKVRAESDCERLELQTFERQNHGPAITFRYDETYWIGVAGGGGIRIDSRFCRREG
jgi:hypothetical protein